MPHQRPQQSGADPVRPLRGDHAVGDLRLSRFSRRHSAARPAPTIRTLTPWAPARCSARACAVITLLLIHRRLLIDKMRGLEARCEELADRNWELREAEERARSLLESQGDLIVRRDGEGRITYANDAFCALAGKSRMALIGKPFELPVLEHGALDVLADGTRVHDQKIASGTGTRWIAWREVAVRTDGRHRSAGRRPRRHRPRRGRTRAAGRARPGRDRQPRQVALPRHGQPRDPHAAQRHPRHGRSACSTRRWRPSS